MARTEPMQIDDLNFAAQIVVWAGRRWICGRLGEGGPGWDGVEEEFRGPLGDEVGSALADGLDRMFGAVAASAARPITLGPLNCLRVWPDELGLLSAVACAQAGDLALAVRYFEQLLHPTGVRAAVPLADEIGRLLREAGYVIGPACREGRPAMARAGIAETHGATIH